MAHTPLTGFERVKFLSVTTAPWTSEPKAGDEDLLLSHLQRLLTEPSGSFGVHIYLSGLRSGNRRVISLSSAKRLLDEFASGHNATLFSLSNADLVLLCRNMPVEEVDSVLKKVRGLFPDDPLTQSDIGTYEDRFTSWHDLSQPDDFRSYYVKIKDQAAAAAVRLEKEIKNFEARQHKANIGTPLAPNNLAAIDQIMRKTQIADIIRNQSVYHLASGRVGAVMFREYFIAMNELKFRVAPSVNLFGNPWLFQYLTETLDRRMLAVMSRRNLAQMDGSISLNLNINTIMSRDFQQFHDSLGNLTSRVVVEMQVIDIFSDLPAYRYARDLLQERGYRVLVDGLSPLAINFIDPSVLRADYLKISWNPEIVDEIQDDIIGNMRKIVSKAGKDDVILSRVDSQEAIKWGAGLGISRFQGHLIDKLTAATKTQKSAPAGTEAGGNG